MGLQGYAVSTVEFDEEHIQPYIRHQETLDTKGYDQNEADTEDDNKNDGYFKSIITYDTGHPWGGSQPLSYPHCGDVITHSS